MEEPPAETGPGGPTEPPTASAAGGPGLFGDHPGAWAELPAEPRRMPLHRRPGVIAALGTAVWLAAAWAVFTYLGVGGWRYGIVTAVVIVGGGTAGVVWALCRRGVPDPGLWATASLVIGVTLAVVSVNSAPMSVGRLEQQIDDMHIKDQFFTPVSQTTSGHGWCSPHCPEVIRVYRAPNGSYQEALVVAYIGLQRIGFPGNIKQEYDQQVGLVVRRLRRHLVATVTLDRPADGHVRLTVALESR